MHREGCGNISDCAHRVVGEYYDVTPDGPNPSNPETFRVIKVTKPLARYSDTAYHMSGKNIIN